MNTRSTAQGYSGLQIALHWIVVLLVAYQLIFGEDMGRLMNVLERGETPDSSVATGGTLHIWVGFAVLAAVALRLIARFWQGVPPEVEGSALAQRAAQITHILFYVLLVGLPVSGAVAYYGGVEAAGEVHEIGKPVMIILIALHVLAALWHQFVRRDGGLMRMVVPR